MSGLIARDVAYDHHGTRMIGRLVAPAGAHAAPTVLLVHDAFGLGDAMVAHAERIAARGLAVFAADVWGERTTPATEPEIGPLIGGMVSDRPRWTGRLTAALEAAKDQPEVDPSAVVALGYCFGGSSALELARQGGDVRGVVAIHPGLDLISFDWERPPGDLRVLVCVGAADPMATAQQRALLQDALDGAGVHWEVDLYGGAKHAFTNPSSQHSPNPDVVAYDPRAAARAWAATTRFLGELFPDLPAADPA